MAEGSRAGLVSQASMSSLPAAGMESGAGRQRADGCEWRGVGWGLPCQVQDASCRSPAQARPPSAAQRSAAQCSAHPPPPHGCQLQSPPAPPHPAAAAPRLRGITGRRGVRESSAGQVCGLEGLLQPKDKPAAHRSRPPTSGSSRACQSASSPPSDMTTTAGRSALACSQSSASSTSDTEPEPSQSKMRTACSVAPRATPNDSPPATPATCVPWPSQSVRAGWGGVDGCGCGCGVGGGGYHVGDVEASSCPAQSTHSAQPIPAHTPSAPLFLFAASRPGAANASDARLPRRPSA